MGLMTGIMRGAFPTGLYYPVRRVIDATTITTALSELWAAPGPCFVRGVGLFEDAANPVTSTGASTLNMGLNGTGTNIQNLLASISIAQLGTGQVAGWGIRGASSAGGTNGPNPNGSAGVLLVPQNSMGSVGPADTTRDGVYAKIDAGTLDSGNIVLVLEYRPVSF